MLISDPPDVLDLVIARLELRRVRDPEPGVCIDCHLSPANADGEVCRSCAADQRDEDAAGGGE